MKIMGVGQIKHYLSRALKPYWSTTVRAYAGFNDPSYAIVPEELWLTLLDSAPETTYRPHVFDCEDIAMQFKVHVAISQIVNDPDGVVTSPFAVGLAIGDFAWVNGRHAANFVFIDAYEGLELRWYDLHRREQYPFGAIRPGLVGVII